jgi:hypothetical protein
MSMMKSVPHGAGTLYWSSRITQKKLSPLVAVKCKSSKEIIVKALITMEKRMMIM